MHSVQGVINAVQEGRFQLAADDGRVLQFVLSHKAGVEPQDLPRLQAASVRVRVNYDDGGRLIAGIAKGIEAEE